MENPRIFKFPYLRILLILFSTGTVSAQQLPLFSVYRDQSGVLNPASISGNYLLNEMNYSIGASYRRQWMDLKDGPNTQVVNFEYIPKERDELITGGHIIRDQTGKIGQTGIYGRFAYRLELGRRVDHALSIGIGAGLVQYRAKLNDIRFAEPEISDLDKPNVLYPDFSLGVYYYYSDKLYAGISVPQTFGLSTVYRDTSGSRAFDIRRVQHLYGVVGGYFDVEWFGSSTSFIEPSLWIRYVPRGPVSLNFNARYQISDFYWFGLGGGVGMGSPVSSALHLETGMKLGESLNILNSQWTIAFAYDVPLGKYRSFLGNIFEVSVVYSWFD
ncbi:MAG: PorP/SprF family type IX secretion system membrane protein [Lewinellaceae bacterium]|nr:PorP/SprF family type IX secretion system membrane protein [Lewinella sp.]MCB9280170.1 PorP/SprF family type IX secretion system membrane protein [Lewinellaceae bacterium]